MGVLRAIEFEKWTIARRHPDAVSELPAPNRPTRPRVSSSASTGPARTVVLQSANAAGAVVAAALFAEGGTIMTDVINTRRESSTWRRCFCLLRICLLFHKLFGGTQMQLR
ncbi:MAG: hypothetical protein ACLR67_00655 [Eggerthella lenta]